MISFSHSAAASVTVLAYFTACDAGRSTRTAVRLDLTSMLEEAWITLPEALVERQIDLATGSRQFDRDGHVHLTRQHAFSNQMRFRSLPEATATEIELRYRARWTESSEQKLSFLLEAGPADGDGNGVVIEIVSDGTIRALAHGQTLASTRTFTTTNDVWRDYRLRLEAGARPRGPRT